MSQKRSIPARNALLDHHPIESAFPSRDGTEEIERVLSALSAQALISIQRQ
jgi:hypothetical protein